MKRVVLPDVHFPYHDQHALDLWLEFVEDFQPDGVDIIGDLMDCVSPETKVLTYDLRWVPAGDLRPGDRLIGFDETNPELMVDGRRRKQRCLRDCRVLRAGIDVRPRLALKVETGEELLVSTGHPFLCWFSTKNRAELVWATAEEIKRRVDRGSPVLLHRPTLPWSEDTSYEGGFLRAAFDGEGFVSFDSNANNFGHLAFCQKENPFLEEVEEYLTGAGFKTNRQTSTSGTVSLHIRGGMWECARFIGTYRPGRFVDKWVAVAPIDGYAMSATNRPRVVGVEERGKGEVVALETSTKTFFAEGFSSHNCYSLSRFDKNPERKLCLQSELDMARKFLERLRARVHKGCDIRYSEGNHENRLKRVLWGKCSALAGLRNLEMPELLGLGDLNIAWHSMDNPYKIGDVHFMHGDVIRKHGGSTARTISDKVGGSVIIGHSHRMGMVPTTTWGGCQMAYEVGHLCDPRKAEYVSGVPNWQQGWALVTIGKGWHNVEFARVVRKPGRHGTHVIFREDAY